MEIPFIGGGYSGRSLNLDSQICQNLYPVIDQQGGKKVIALMNTPGLVLFAAPASSGCRGIHVMGDYLYTVHGATVYRLNSNGNATTITGSLLTNTGNVWMANNGTQVMIVDGSGYGYTITGTTLTQITDADFPSASSLTFQDGYFIVSKISSGQFNISASYDGTNWDALDFATAEGDPDNLQAIISAHRELWLLGKTSYEVWYNSGASAFPFERVPGAVNRVGCIAPFSLAEHQGLIAWLDDQRFIRQAQGYDTQIISTPQINYQIAQYSVVSDAKGFIYSQEGHTFYVLIFSNEGKTWAYDFTTGFWHTRATGIFDARHPVNAYALFNDMQIVGDPDNGNLYKYDLSKYSDNGNILRRIRSAQSINSDRKRIFHSMFEIEFETGVGASTGAAEPYRFIDDENGQPILDENGQPILLELEASYGYTFPSAMLQWSDDGGHTWSNEHWAQIGASGNYKTRVIWRKLGSSRDRVYKVIVSDPVKTVIIGANLEAEGGNS